VGAREEVDPLGGKSVVHARRESAAVLVRGDILERGHAGRRFQPSADDRIQERNPVGQLALEELHELGLDDGSGKVALPRFVQLGSLEFEHVRAGGAKLLQRTLDRGRDPGVRIRPHPGSGDTDPQPRDTLPDHVIRVIRLVSRSRGRVDGAEGVAQVLHGVGEHPHRVE